MCTCLLVTMRINLFVVLGTFFVCEKQLHEMVFVCLFVCCLFVNESDQFTFMYSAWLFTVACNYVCLLLGLLMTCLAL